MSDIDWLSHLLQMITVTGRLEVRCVYAAPWRVAWPRAAAMARGRPRTISPPSWA